MFQDGPIDGLIVREMSFYEDDRGSLAELFRIDELEDGMRPEMGYVSMTLPGVVRGPHAHRDQTDLFAFYGPGDSAVGCPVSVDEGIEAALSDIAWSPQPERRLAQKKSVDIHGN